MKLHRMDVGPFLAKANLEGYNGVVRGIFRLGSMSSLLWKKWKFYVLSSTYQRLNETESSLDEITFALSNALHNTYWKFN